METQLVRGLRVAAIETFAGLATGFIFAWIAFFIYIAVRALVM